MSSEKILGKVKEFIEHTFKEKGPENNTYHNLIHTAEVVNITREIAEANNVSDTDLEMLQIAAWFHDIGYVEKCEGHEEVSVAIAKEFLFENNYPAEKINKVISLIEVTKMPQNPANLLEEIICDADLHHIGSKDFEEKGEGLRDELEKTHGLTFSDEGWLKKNRMFFNMHKFYTPYARERFEAQKNINIHKIEKRLKKLKEKNQFSDSDSFSDGSKKGKKKDLDKNTGAGRSIETMFRNTMRTHVDFSSMADTKANILISVNTLVLTIIVSIMVRKLDTNPHLIIPTALLTITCLVTLVYAIIVTRPKITSGTFTEEDIKRKKVNLLFFGNFYNMSLKDFTWGMNEMIGDREFLYDSMIQDFYYLGQVLGKKYQKLRIAYTIFMYGVIISVIAFALAFILFPGGTNLGPLID